MAELISAWGRGCNDNQQLEKLFSSSPSAGRRSGLGDIEFTLTLSLRIEKELFR
jgi:hypothetical protein